MISDQIKKINDTTLESLDEKDTFIVLKKFIDTGLKVLKADFGFSWRKLEGENKYQLAYKSPGTPYSPTPPRKRGGNQIAHKTKTPFYVEDTKKEKYPKQYDVSMYMKSYVIIPIFFQKHNYGNLIFCYKRHHVFTKEDKTLSVTLGNSLAQAVTIQRLYFNLKDFKNRLDHTLDSVFIFDPVTFRIEYANLGTFKQLGYDRHEIYKKNIIDIQPNVDLVKFRKQIAPLIWKRKESISLETVLQTKAGRNIPVELFIQLSGSLGGPRKFLSIVHDLTERKKVEQEAAKLLKQKDEFFGVASHELKTPVTTIKGFTQMLTEKLQGRDEESKYFLNKINTQVEKLTHLVNDLLDVSRIETGKLKFEKREIDLNKLTFNLVENFQYITTSHSVFFSSEGQFWVQGDSQRIEQVLTNLITNAIKYSPPDSKILVNLSESEGKVKVEVEDFGFGISKQDQDKVFKRFFQSKNRGRKIYPGLGLGLFIARTIVKHHGGELNFVSKKTGGTIFYVTLPCTKWETDTIQS